LVAVSPEKNGASELFPPEVGSLPSGGSIALSPSAGNTPLRRTYLIVLDTLNSSLANFAQVRDALKKLFKQEEGADSQYALITLGKPTRVIQNLTRDLDAILAAIESKNLNKSMMTSEHSNLAQPESELRGILEHCPPPSKSPKSGPEEPCPTAENFAEMAAGERDIITRNLINDLRVLTEQLAGMPGKRALILASDGFNLQPGRELFELIAAYENDPSGLLHNQTRHLTAEIAPIVRLATARNVTLYTPDSRGPYTVPAGRFDSSQRAARRSYGGNDRSARH
jgi:VWFA-related protein